MLDRTWADPALDTAVAAIRAGDLETPLALLKPQTTDPDRRAIWSKWYGKSVEELLDFGQETAANRIAARCSGRCWRPR